MINFTLCIVALAILLSFVRFIKGNSMADRVVALDTMSIIIISLLIILSISLKEPYYLDIAFVFGLIDFIGVVLFARFNQMYYKKSDND